MKKISLVLLTLLTVFALFSCSNGENEETNPDQQEDVQPQAELVIADNGQTEMKIIRPSKNEGYYKETFGTVYRKFMNLYSSSVEVSDDWINPKEPSPEKDLEILLFNTNRIESEQALEELTFTGYIIRVTDCKIVIVASSPNAYTEALYKFFDLLEENTVNGKTALPVGYEIMQELETDSVDIGKAFAEGKEVFGHYEVLFSYPGHDGFTVSQGATSDGTYAYVAMKKASGDREVDSIVKIDMKTWKVVKKSETLPLDHANDMTYDPIKNVLIVTNMYEKLVSIIDADTLEMIEQKTLKHGSYGAGYIHELDQYTFLGDGKVIITDSSFNVIRSYAQHKSTGYTGQGMDADVNYSYLPRSPGSGASNNIITVQDINTGEYVGTITLDTGMESESMFHVGDDKYIHFNHGGSKIALVTFYLKFE